MPLRQMRCPKAGRSQHVCDATCPYEPVEPNKTLAQLAREAANKKRYGDHRDKEERERARHQLDIDKATRDLEQDVQKAAERGEYSLQLRLPVNGCVTGDRQDGGDFYENKRLTCGQCIRFKEHLEHEGFVVSISEDKYNFHLKISWEESA